MHYKNSSWSAPWKAYIAEGFQSDCDDLIRKCTQVKKLSYEKFCNIWKEMDFACVFYSTHSGAEIAEFTDEAMLIAKTCMFAKASNFEETVAGVFLVYAILNLQPFVGFSPLKLIDEDVQYIEQIEQMARSQRRYDLLYILGSLLIKGPVQYHVAHRERGLEANIRKYLEDDYKNEFHGGFKGVFTRSKEELDLLGEIKALGDIYTKTKVAVSDSTALNRNLSYINNNIPMVLEKSLKTVIFGVEKQSLDESEEVEGTDSKGVKRKSESTVSSIKEKAMKLSVNPMKHLIGIQDRKARETKTEKTSSPQKSSPQKSSTQKISPQKSTTKKSSKYKLSPLNSKTRNKSPTKTKKLKKRKFSIESRIVFESSDDSDNHMSLHDSDDSNDLDSDSHSAKNDSDNIKLTKNSEEIQIEVNTLPVLITTRSDSLCEIEIIDHYKKTPLTIDKTEITENEKVDIKKKNLEKTKPNTKSNKTTKETSVENAETVKKVVKREKRDLKKPRVASSLHRLGLQDMVKVTKKKK